MDQEACNGIVDAASFVRSHFSFLDGMWLAKWPQSRLVLVKNALGLLAYTCVPISQ